MIGAIPHEHTRPEGSVVVEMKYCEVCGFLFARKDRDRYCRKCHAAPVPLDRQEEIRILKELYEEKAVVQ